MELLFFINTRVPRDSGTYQIFQLDSEYILKLRAAVTSYLMKYNTLSKTVKII